MRGAALLSALVVAALCCSVTGRVLNGGPAQKPSGKQVIRELGAAGLQHGRFEQAGPQ